MDARSTWSSVSRTEAHHHALPSPTSSSPSTTPPPPPPPPPPSHDLVLYVHRQAEQKGPVFFCVLLFNTCMWRSQLLARWPATHSRILSTTQRAAQTVLGVYLKRTCSRVTSASSALAVRNDYALYTSTHSRDRNR